jgi:hypothetical protein
MFFFSIQRNRLDLQWEIELLKSSSNIEVGRDEFPIYHTYFKRFYNQHCITQMAKRTPSVENAEEYHQSVILAKFRNRKALDRGPLNSHKPHLNATSLLFFFSKCFTELRKRELMTFKVLFTFTCNLHKVKRLIPKVKQ